MTSVGGHVPGGDERDPARVPIPRGTVDESNGRTNPSDLAELAHSPVLDALDAAVIVSDVGGVILYANPAAERMYGHPRSALLGANVRNALVGQDNLRRADEIMAQVLAGRSWHGEFDVPHADGGVRTVSITNAPVYRDGQVVAVVGVADDVTGSRRVRRNADRFSARLGRLAQVTAALASAQDVATAVRTVVEEAASAVGAEVSSVSLLTDDNLLVLGGMHGAEPALEQRWASYRLDTQLPGSEAVRTGQPVITATREEMERRYPALVGHMPGERSTICLPLAVLDQRLGVLTLSFKDARIPDETEMTFLGAVADACAQTLARLKALEEARASAAKLAFLAEASVELAASLDLDRTLNNVAGLVVPRLADWCVVHVVDGDGYRPVAVAHADPAKAAWGTRPAGPLSGRSAGSSWCAARGCHR